ncbi:hypothetical protein [Lentzea atacamensis]|uniref:hypothetical protein n=1 Tax=Lentzea atacamensis TaxID=531938 RepID=UPI0011BF58A4|nr:hypothetical protein [Lentzea atacamensis]
MHEPDLVVDEQRFRANVGQPNLLSARRYRHDVGVRRLRQPESRGADAAPQIQHAPAVAGAELVDVQGGHAFGRDPVRGLVLFGGPETKVQGCGP